MNSATVERLRELNRQFYARRGRDFAETRLRIQPGALRIIRTLGGNETILDLGCGTGIFARELSHAGHRGRYLGIDSSRPLLDYARGGTYAFPADFLRADLTQLPNELPALFLRGESDLPRPQASERQYPYAESGCWSMIAAFAVLHHIPGNDLRLALLRSVRELLCPGGQLVLSNWQFTSSNRLRGRIQPWSSLGIELDPDPGDYLLDWRRGQLAFRYVHEFDEPELERLAVGSGYVVTETFYSDGEDHKSGLYQRWRPT